jgi:hypothetical protein
VKTLQDANASSVNMNKQAKKTTVKRLRALRAPYRPIRRVRGVETVVYDVNVLILGMKMETDEDFHVVIADPTNPSLTMIAEIPASNCANPKFTTQFVAAREVITSLAKPGPGRLTRLKEPVKARFIGIGFFDKLHRQTGVAPNGIELHPVLSIQLESH